MVPTTTAPSPEMSQTSEGLTVRMLPKRMAKRSALNPLARLMRTTARAKPPERNTAMAVFLSGGFALAVVLISLASGFNADLFAILFGSILTVSPSDVWLISALGAVVVATILASYRRLFVITLHEDLARTSGVPVTALNLM